MWQTAFMAAVGLMTVCIALGVGLFLGYVSTLPPIEQLENYDPPEITRLLDRTGMEPIGEFKVERREVVPLSRVPLLLRMAFVAVEDSRFYEHYGIDPLGILRALIVNFRAGTIRQGGSTITQQLTRNILRREVGTERKLSRKIKEAILALQIERRYSKDQILEFYLNTIPFGALGGVEIYGVQEAASSFFSKSLQDLTLAEIATLAGMPNAPTLYNPVLRPRDALQRRNLVLRRMLEAGVIDHDAYEAAVAEPLRVNPSTRAVDRYPYFTDALRRDLQGYYGVREMELKTAGYRITTTLDTAIQEACTAALRSGLVQAERLWQETKPARMAEERREWNGVLRENDVRLMRITAIEEGRLRVNLERYNGTVEMPPASAFHEPQNVLKVGGLLDVRVRSVNERTGEFTGVCANTTPLQGSVVALDARTGEVLALAGGTAFYDRDAGGYFNRAIMGGRQVGSCFKPFVYAEAFERGIGPHAIVVDTRVEFGNYSPVNYERNPDGSPRYYGPTTLIEALEHSRNVATIRLFHRLGVAATVRELAKFDFTGIGQRWRIPPELPVCLGTIDCSPIQMAAAYQPFVNLGVGVRPQFFKSVVNAAGRIAVPLKYRETQILDPIAAYQTQYLLRQVVLRGTGQAPIGDKFPSPPFPPIAGKTGTTDDCVDAWFIGFTPDLILAVQVGFDTPMPLGPRMTGGRVAGPIWAEAFRAILATRSGWRTAFEAPPGIERVDICAMTGKRATARCRAEGHRSEIGDTIYEGVPYRAGTAPTEPCDGRIATPLIGNP